MTVTEIPELAKPGLDPIPSGYKQTEVGVIPEDWKVKQLKELFSLKNGYSFKGEFFSNKGPIILTPGNFKLEGGLYFEARNTKRYTACYPKGYEFKKGDLVIVMTDLTPDCNLLGKPAFIELEEQVLHNQRIGKITQLVTNWKIRFLYYTLLSPVYLSTIKNAATGSTVRHTSPGTISSVWVPEPPQEEQTVIANVLSDVDALISELEKLIAKKQAIKTATMQQLLAGLTRLPQFALREDGSKKGTKRSELGEIPEDWEVVRLGEIIEFKNGAAHEDCIDEFGDFILVNSKFISTEGKVHKGTNQCRQGASKNDLLMVMSDVPNGKAIAKCFFVKEDNLYTVNQRVCILKPLEEIDPVFLLKILSRNLYYLAFDDGAKQTNLRKEDVLSCPLIKPSKVEQTAIATILSDMDEEIQSLEHRLSKTRQIKQGMMQELLTGRTRLVQR